eukprot:592330-Amphidinium_carterae.1
MSGRLEVSFEGTGSFNGIPGTILWRQRRLVQQQALVGNHAELQGTQEHEIEQQVLAREPQMVSTNRVPPTMNLFLNCMRM